MKETFETDWNAELGKMEDTSLPHWQEYYRKLNAFNERMEAKKPMRPDREWFPDDASFERALDGYQIRLGEWEMSLSCDRPNKPGYYRAAND